MRARLRAPVNSGTERTAWWNSEFDVTNVSTFHRLLRHDGAEMRAPRVGQCITTWADLLENPQFKGSGGHRGRVNRCARSCGCFPVCGGGDPATTGDETGIRRRRDDVLRPLTPCAGRPADVAIAGAEVACEASSLNRRTLILLRLSRCLFTRRWEFGSRPISVSRQSECSMAVNASPVSLTRRFPTPA